MKAERETKRVMKRCREAFTASELTLDEVGQKMGYPPGQAKVGVHNFLNKTADPRLSMLIRFAKAVDVPVSQLIGE